MSQPMTDLQIAQELQRIEAIVRVEAAKLEQVAESAYERGLLDTRDDSVYAAGKLARVADVLQVRGQLPLS